MVVVGLPVPTVDVDTAVASLCEVAPFGPRLGLAPATVLDVVAPQAVPEARQGGRHIAGDEADTVPAYKVRGPVRTRVVDTTGKVRAPPDGTRERRLGGRGPCTPNGAATKDGREGRRPRAPVRKVTRPAAVGLPRRVVALGPPTAKPDVGVVAVEVVATSLEGPLPRQGEPAIRATVGAVEPQGTTAVAGLVPVLFPPAVGLRLDEGHGARRQETGQAKARPAPVVPGGPCPARVAPSRVRLSEPRARAPFRPPLGHTVVGTRRPVPVPPATPAYAFPRHAYRALTTAATATLPLVGVVAVRPVPVAPS